MPGVHTDMCAALFLQCVSVISVLMHSFERLFLLSWLATNPDVAAVAALHTEYAMPASGCQTVLNLLLAPCEQEHYLTHVTSVVIVAQVCACAFSLVVLGGMTAAFAEA
jgi:hypothetical protein